jgi:hypothetical protein
MKIFPDSVLALALVISLILLVDPFMYWMPPFAGMIALVAATALLCVFAGFVMLERAVDEREAMHRMNAGRVAYLSGIAVLTAALLFQGLTDMVDPWIAGALGAMVIAKLIARVFFESNG